MDVPEEQIERLKGVPKEKFAEEGIKIAVETIERVRRSRVLQVSTLWPLNGEDRVRRRL